MQNDFEEALNSLEKSLDYAQADLAAAANAFYDIVGELRVKLESLEVENSLLLETNLGMQDSIDELLREVNEIKEELDYAKTRIQ